MCNSECNGCGGCKSCSHTDPALSEEKQAQAFTEKEYDELRATTPISSVIINVTDNCNLRCPYCFTERNTAVSSLEVMQETIRFLIGEKERTGTNIPIQFAFFGGEPMLHFHDIIKPTIEWATNTGIKKEHNINFSMTTNGTLFDEDILRFLWAHDCNILLSIDGDKETQDNQRPAAVGSSFDKIAPMIPYILKYYPWVTFRSTVEPWNADKLLHNYLFARDKGFKHYFCTPNIYSEWSDEQTDTMLKNVAAAVMVMYEDIKDGNDPLEVDFFFEYIQKIFDPPSPDSLDNLRRCGLGTVSMGVGCDGTINGCQEHNTYHENRTLFEIGNIFTGIDKEKHIKLLSEYTRRVQPVCSDDPARCDRCAAKDTCGSGYCPSSSLGRNSDISGLAKVSCMWSDFFARFTTTFLEIVKKENNHNVITFMGKKFGGSGFWQQ